MPKLIWEKKLQEAVKRQQRFGWSVREKRGKVLMQRYQPDTNKKTTVALPIAWEPNHELSVLNAPFNQYGEVFVVKTSLILELDPICQWSDFDKVIDNSKFIPIEWKKQKEVYASQLISPYSKELKVLLNEFSQAAKNKSKQFSIEEIQKNSLSKILSIPKFKKNYSEKP